MKKIKFFLADVIIVALNTFMFLGWLVRGIFDFAITFTIGFWSRVWEDLDNNEENNEESNNDYN